MPTIQAAPAEGLFDPVTRKPRFGTYAGGLPPLIDLAEPALSSLTRLQREKRWMYVVLASEEIIFATAIIRLGYAANSFAFVVDRRTGELLVDRKALGVPMLVSVNERAGEGHESKFRFIGADVSIRRPLGSEAYALDLRMPDLSVEASLSTRAAPPALGVIASLEGGRYSTTEKRALLAVEGSLIARGRRYSLDGALAGYDYTAGLLERRTAWRWAFSLGRTRDGRPIAMNLTEGFVGGRECALWLDGKLYGLSPAAFSFQPSTVMKPWGIRTEAGELDLTFKPSALHEEQHDFRVLRSRFLQLVGSFEGRIEVPGEEAITIDRLPGVSEDQDTLW